MLVDHPVGGAENASKTVEPAKFLIIDDHPLFRDALQITIRLTYPRAQITEAIARDSVNALQGYVDGTELVFSLGTNIGSGCV